MIIANLAVKISADASELTTVLNGISSRLENFGKEAAKTGAFLSAGLTLPLVGIAKSALETATSFQSSLNLMQAVSGATAEQMAAVGRKAKELGADMELPATSAADAATAMTELAKAGLSVEQSMAAAKGVLQLAAAGQLSNSAAAEIAANALNAFSLTGDKATKVANLLAAAANSSSAEVRDIADALKMSSAVFASAKIPIEHLVAAIGQMANAGIKGSDAGTSLKQMILSLQAPTDKAQKLMQSLGISIYDSRGQMLPFSEIIDQFSTKLSVLTQEQRNSALATIFGSDAIRAANIIMMGGLDAHKQMLDAVTKEGAASDLAAARMKGLGGAILGLKSQIETVLLDVAEPFLTVLEEWVRKIAELVPRISDIDPQLRNMAIAAGVVLAAAGPLVVMFGALSAAIGFLVSPIGAIIALSALLAAAWTGNLFKIRDHVEQLVATLMSWVEMFRSTIVEPMIAQINTLQSTWSSSLENIESTFTSVWDTIRSVVGTVVSEIVSFIFKEFGIIISWTMENWPLIQRVVETVLTSISNIVSTTLTLIQGFWKSHGDQILFVVGAAWKIVQIIVETVLRTILGFLRTIMFVIVGDWSAAWTSLLETANVLLNGIWSVISFVFTMIYEQIILPILTDIQKVWGSAWDWVGSKISETWLGIVSTTKNAINDIIRFINRLISAWNQLEFRIPPINISLPKIRFPDGTTIGGQQLSFPGFTIKFPTIPTIPELAQGGIVTQPTIAMIGENGPEAVIPLRNTIDYNKLARILTSRPVVVELDGRVIAEVVRTELIKISRRNVTTGIV